MAGYTLEQLKSMGAKKQGYTLAELKTKETPQIQKQSLANKIWADLSQRGINLESEISKGSTGQQSPVVTGFKATAEAFGGIGDVATDVVEATPVVGGLYKKFSGLLQKGFTALTNKIANTKMFKEAAQAPGGTPKLDEMLQVLSSGGEIANNILVAEGVKQGITKTVQITKEIPELVKRLTAESEKSINETIITSYEKGVKPNLGGKTTANRVENYRKDIVQAAKTIKDNKANLSFADEIEGTIGGQTPKTLQQMTEAIEQTKKTIFNDYDSLAKQAGEAGVKVDLKPIAKELDSVIKSKSIAISNPEVIKLAKGAQERLLAQGQIDAMTAQEVIQNYNNALEAYYKNPTYEAASRATMEAMIANRMRLALDEGINNLTGARYSLIKGKYGSLKAIEKDVVKASLREARKNVKGLIDFSDILSGGQLVNGLITLNPGLIAQAGIQKGIASFFKYLNDPNRAIQRLFEAVERLP